MTGYELIFIIGILMLLGYLMGRFFKKVHLPEIFGIIMTGVIIEIVLKYILHQEGFLHLLLHNLRIVISIALGLEAFSIGSEFTHEEKNPEGFIKNLIFLQAIFITIFTLLGIFIFSFIDKTNGLHIKQGLLIGSLIGATAPIAVLELFYNFKKDKKLTRGLNKMVSSDNASGIIYFLIIYAISRQPSSINISDTANSLIGLGMEIALGTVVGLILVLLNKFVIRPMFHKQHKDIAYVFIILSVLLMAITGSVLLSESARLENFYISEFVVAFIAGAIFGNIIKVDENHHQVHVIHNFIPPLLTVFFVIVGMELDFTQLASPLGLFVVLFIIALILLKSLFGYLYLNRIGIKEEFKEYLSFGVITKSSFEVYLAHLAMISSKSDMLFIVILISLVLFETLEPILLSKTKLNQLENLQPSF